MPGMGGVGLATRLRSETPGLRVLFMSGYADRAVPREPGIGVLQKPFDPSLLLGRVSELLSSPVRAAGRHRWFGQRPGRPERAGHDSSAKRSRSRR